MREYITLAKVKKLLDSLYIFDNRISLLTRYLLNVLGFRVKLIARIQNCLSEVSPEAFVQFVSMLSRGLIKSVKCIDGELFINDVKVNSINDAIFEPDVALAILIKGYDWKYDAKNGYWIKGIRLRGDVRFRHMRYSILQVFEYGEYGFVNIENRDVVDVGAFIGDSAIYFALKGARRVVALEPHPEAYKEMIENIKLNNLEDKIIPINAGLASKPGKICIENIDIERAASTYYSLGDCPTSVPSITLAEVINTYHIDSEAVLKMDCEGCEYDIILNDYEYIKHFKELIFEYHAHAMRIPVDVILNKLTKDYKCEIVDGKGFFKRLKCNKKLIGIVRCIRNEKQPH
jgi:FkbM family methyltransferase